MYMKSLADINRAIAKAVGDRSVSLFKGYGYLYLVYDTPEFYDTQSVMVPYLSDLMPAEWIKLAVDFADDCWHRSRRQRLNWNARPVVWG